MDIGDVFYFSSLQVQHQGKDKPRWIVFLGLTQWGSALTVTITPTTRWEHVETGGSKAHLKRVEFEAVSSVFDEDCYMTPPDLYWEKISTHNIDKNATPKGTITKEKAIEIHNMLVGSSYHAFNKRKIIHENFLQAGYEQGLLKPKK